MVLLPATVHKQCEPTIERTEGDKDTTGITLLTRPFDEIQLSYNKIRQKGHCTNPGSKHFVLNLKMKTKTQRVHVNVSYTHS